MIAGRKKVGRKISPLSYTHAARRVYCEQHNCLKASHSPVKPLACLREKPHCSGQRSGSIV